MVELRTEVYQTFLVSFMSLRFFITEDEVATTWTILQNMALMSPQHGLSAKKTALISSDYGRMRSLRIKWLESPRGCARVQAAHDEAGKSAMKALMSPVLLKKFAEMVGAPMLFHSDPHCVYFKIQ